MKKNILIGAGVILVVLIGLVAYGLITTKSHSPFKEKNASFNGTDITVAYCQPYKKGRVIFGKKSEDALQPYGKYWRLGANEATLIVFSSDVNFGGKHVAAGNYVMYAVPGKDTFEVSLNTEVGRWGAKEVDHDLDVVTVTSPTSESNEIMEQFTINFNEEGETLVMTFEWDKTVVSVPITN